MPYQEFQENWKSFSELIDQFNTAKDEKTVTLIKRYIEQNLAILNDAFAISIEHLKKLQKINSANDIICLQAKFALEISKKLSQRTQHFMDASLGSISDYNEWLKAHCDSATD